MKEQLISFECAKLAKEKGFDWGQMTQSNVKKWLRDEKGVFVSLVASHKDIGVKWLCNVSTYNRDKIGNIEKLIHVTPRKEYEQALEAGLIEALKLI